MPRTGMTAQEIREKAIDCAIARIRRQGFEKVRLVDIAKDLGVSHVALYSHFVDKSALLDAVSERWLTELDAKQEVICQMPLSPLERIEAWLLNLHRAKREKVMQDPELYKAFNLASEAMKPFVKAHLETSNRQLATMVKEAMALKLFYPIEGTAMTVETMVNMIMSATIGFHHPKLVLEHWGEDREDALKSLLHIVFRGIGHA